MERISEWEENKKRTAQFFGISTQGLDGWIHRGCPCERRGKALMFYLPEVVIWRYTQDDSDGKLDLTAERARLAKEQADKTAMENARLRGELVPVAAVRELLEKILSTFKTRILSIPTKMAPLMLGLKSLPEARDLIDDHLHDAMNELSRLNISQLRSGSGVARNKAAAKADRKPVGRSGKAAQSGSKRGARTVANG